MGKVEVVTYYFILKEKDKLEVNLNYKIDKKEQINIQLCDLIIQEIKDTSSSNKFSFTRPKSIITKPKIRIKLE